MSKDKIKKSLQHIEEDTKNDIGTLFNNFLSLRKIEINNNMDKSDVEKRFDNFFAYLIKPTKKMFQTPMRCQVSFKQNVSLL